MDCCYYFMLCYVRYALVLLCYARVAAAEKGLPPVIMFAFNDYFPAVAATDLLVSGKRRRLALNLHSVRPHSMLGSTHLSDAWWHRLSLYVLNVLFVGDVTPFSVVGTIAYHTIRENGFWWGLLSRMVHT